MFRLYERVFKTEVIAQEKNEISFYRSFLPACKLIFDIGANDGHKTAAFIHFSEKVVSCEPDPESVNLLRIRFRNKKNRVFIENKAVTNTEGTTELFIHHGVSAFNTISGKWKNLLELQGETRWHETIIFNGKQTVQTTTLDTLIATYGLPDFIKIDTEGSEDLVLKGLSKRVPFLSFESLLPEYRNELEICLSRIESLNATVTYNIALHEKLLFDGFVTRQQLNEWITGNENPLAFEVIAKMTL